MRRLRSAVRLQGIPNQPPDVPGRARGILPREVLRDTVTLEVSNMEMPDIMGINEEGVYNEDGLSNINIKWFAKTLISIRIGHIKKGD